MHPRLGFQRSYFEESYKIEERIGEWLADKQFFIQTVSFIEKQQEPFLAYLLSSSNHDPWELPQKHRTLDVGHLEGTLLGNYCRSVHYFDWAFGEFVDRLREVGLFDTSVIVLYGDHQAFLGKTVELADLLGFPQHSEYHHLLRRKKVPLIIRLPHGEHAGVRQVTGGHLDVAPTLLSLLGMNEKSQVMLGNDLTQGEDSLVVFRDGSFVDGKTFFVNRLGPIAHSMCYEMESGRRIDCEPFESQRQNAREELEISDLIIRGNLIPKINRMIRSATIETSRENQEERVKK